MWWPVFEGGGDKLVVARRRLADLLRRGGLCQLVVGLSGRGQDKAWVARFDSAVSVVS